MRVPPGHGGVQPDEFEQLGDPGRALPAGRRAGCAPRAARRPSAPRCAADRARRTGPGTPSRPAGAAAQAPAVQRGTSMPSKAIVPAGRLHEPQQRVAERRLPAPGLPDQPERLAAVDVEVHAVHRPQHAPSAVSTPHGKCTSRLARGDQEVTHGVHHVAARCGRRTRSPRPTSVSGGCSVSQRGRPAPGSAARRRSRPAGPWAAGGRPGTVARSGTSPSDQRRGQVGQRAEQPAGVGVRRSLQDVVHRAVLHAPAAVHDQHAVGDAGDDAEVVGDPDDAGAAVGLQLLDQVDDLRLHGHVERGGRLVGDEQRGRVRQRDRDHHPLPHPAGQLVRVAGPASPSGRQADLAEQVGGPAPGGLAGQVLVGAQPLDDAGLPTVRTGFSDVIGSWNTMPGARAADLPQPLRRHRQQVLPLQQRPAVTVATRGGSSPSSASTDTLFPLPDSPTTATVSPGPPCSDSPLTTCAVPRGVRSRTRRSLSLEHAFVRAFARPAVTPRPPPRP